MSIFKSDLQRGGRNVSFLPFYSSLFFIGYLKIKEKACFFSK